MSKYRERAATEIRTERPSETVTPIMRKLVTDSAAMLHRGAPDARTRANAARRYATEHLDELHARVQEQLARRGIGYHLARTPADARRIMTELLGDAKRVAKSKSMVGEEVHLTKHLRDQGIDVLETDIGEYIVDKEGRGPSHITAPALHLNRTRIRELLARTGADLPDDDPVRLSRYVRDVVGAYFRDCDAAITGANQVVASTGRVVIVENEGNVSLGVSHPRKHIIITGYEKVVADEAGALAVLEVLAASATAQPLTSFSHFLGDPLPGQERHIVFVDHGRSAIARDPRYRELLQCIRCGACMNSCPVYRAAGGLSYGSPYMGPIGAVLSPLLWHDGRYADLPFASSLCGRCTEVCPVGIPLHRMLLDLRDDAVRQGHVAGRAERAAWKGWALAFSGATRARAVSALGRVGLRGAGRIIRPKGDANDPRMLPDIEFERDPENLMPLERRNATPTAPAGLDARTAIVGIDEVGIDDPVELFRERAAALGAVVWDAYEARNGDRCVEAAAAIANTGSVLLLGDAAARRPLLGSRRIVVRVDPATVVRYPHQLAAKLGTGEALILTGASRTADIEKQIVRGIHGPEELVIVVAAAPQA
ncbi:MAG: LUD domain-containing protein [Dehalococcoidia bacterium]|nr:LUD domain-containing protein [Dehalococcoidia bacterium]